MSHCPDHCDRPLLATVASAYLTLGHWDLCNLCTRTQQVRAANLSPHTHAKSALEQVIPASLRQKPSSHYPCLDQSRKRPLHLPVRESFCKVSLRCRRTPGDTSYWYVFIVGTFWHLPNTPSMGRERQRERLTCHLPRPGGPCARFHLLMR